MVVLYAVGAMSLTWMTAVAALLLLEKASPLGPRLLPAVGLLLVALGAWVAVAPLSVPGLTLPM
jgi:predicted metal-binding membrane protein